VTKKGEKTTVPTKGSKKLKLNKRTVKDLGAKDASGVKGGTLVKTAGCSLLATRCVLQCAKTANTCVQACR